MEAYAVWGIALGIMIAAASIGTIIVHIVRWIADAVLMYRLKRNYRKIYSFWK